MLTYKGRKPVTGDVQPPPITITYKRRKPIPGDQQSGTTIESLPNDLVVDILARLPGKQIGRSKCVCKRWRSTIRSRPFMHTYRRKYSGVVCASTEGTSLRFFHCPLRRHDEPPEEFNLVGEVDLSRNKGTLQLMVTNRVHGLICSFHRKSWSNIQWLTLHNICTGEKMRIPKPATYGRTFSRYYLGFDPARMVYKFLRITYRFTASSLLGVEMMTLRPPSGPRSTWRKLAVSDLPPSVEYGNLIEVGCDDGLLCWKLRSDNSSLLLFDFSTEGFRFVHLPSACNKPGVYFKAVTRLGERLVLWTSCIFPIGNSGVVTCYVQEEGGGRNWRVSKEFQLPRGFMVFVSCSNGEMLAMVDLVDQTCVHFYSPKDEEEEETGRVLFAGEVPDGVLFCFADANHLHLPLSDVLRGGGGSV